MTDFISQAGLDAGLSLPDDALDHERVAAATLKMAAHLPPGAVIAVQGTWGRGKTDVLARLARMVKADKIPGWSGDVVWINPWQYGTPDLLGPLVVALARLVPPASWSSASSGPALRKAVESILRAGINFGFKASAVTMPGGTMLQALALPADSLVGGLFAALELDKKAPSSDADPVARMGERFKELVDAVIPEARRKAGARLIVCVDDLDRCMPDRQVALLEAVRFLIASGAPATFVVALDPSLARQAVIAHFQTDVFDPDRYLDKMFDLRVNLAAVDPKGLGQLITRHLDRTVYPEGQETRLRLLIDGRLGKGASDALIQQAARALPVSELRNPRVLRRLMDRLYLWALAGDKPAMAPSAEDLRVWLTWLGLIERWPEVRHAVQEEGAEGFTKRFVRVWQRYHAVPQLAGSAQQIAAIMDTFPASIRRLPDSSREPALAELLKQVGADQQAAERQAEVFRGLDQLLVKVGL